MWLWPWKYNRNWSLLLKSCLYIHTSYKFSPGQHQVFNSFVPYTGIQSFCRDLVEVADLLEKAADVELEGTQNLSEIKNKLHQVFAKHGLEKMSPVGGTYDPYQHEIVCHTPAEGLEPGTISTVKQDGYMLHGRTIRHARVGVAVERQDSWFYVCIGPTFVLFCFSYSLLISKETFENMYVCTHMCIYNIVILICSWRPCSHLAICCGWLERGRGWR